MVAFFGDNIVTQVDALVANINGGARNQLANFILTLAAERTNQVS
jgi:hypothetical protein